MGSPFSAIMKMGGSATEMIAGAIGAALAAGDRQKAQDLYNEAIQNIQDLDVPSFENIIAQEVKKQPDVIADPTVREAQMQAMSKMGNLADQQGLDPQALAQLQEARQSTEQAAYGANQAIQSGFQRRGMSGSGDELAAQLSGAQQASQRANSAGVNIAGDARGRALKALSDQSDMAGKIRAGDFGEGEANRKAAMAREDFNANMRSAAQAGNVAQRQAIFNAAAKKAGLLNKADTDLAQQYYDNADRTEKQVSGVGRGMNEGASAAGDAFGGMM